MIKVAHYDFKMEKTEKVIVPFKDLELGDLFFCLDQIHLKHTKTLAFSFELGINQRFDTTGIVNPVTNVIFVVSA